MSTTHQGDPTVSMRLRKKETNSDIASVIRIFITVAYSNVFHLTLRNDRNSQHSLLYLLSSVPHPHLLGKLLAS